MNWKEYLALTLGPDFYKLGVDIYEGLNISKDGLSREEDVAVMHSTLDDEMGRDIGAKIFKAVYGKESDRDDGSK